MLPIPSRGDLVRECDPPALERIIQEHLFGGRVVEDLLVATRRLEQAGSVRHAQRNLDADDLAADTVGRGDVLTRLPVPE